MALNPIQFTSQVIEEFRRYQLTAFPIADPRLAAQASALLGAGAFKDSPLTKGPYVSLARGFREGTSLAAMVDEGLIHPALPGVAEFPSVFAHQEETLRAALGGRHVLVSTGTGSGKTESFLYPIIDRCLRMRDAAEPDGVVAVLVYPMNALAADQRDRLRLLLAGTGITYGMYVGSTPRRPSDSDVTQLPQGADREALLAARRKRKANDVDVVPFEECASEQEIRERKPRILITNANQLELLITRQKDFELFTGAPLSFIVLDEAHTYSGATGAEVACLVRRLRAFAARSADEVTCIATSATIVDPERGAEVAPEFLARLCGVPHENVELVTEHYAALDWPGSRSIPAEPGDPDAVLAAVLDALGAAPSPEEGQSADDEAAVDREALADAVAELTGARPVLPEGGVAEALFEHLARMEPVRILAEELEHARDLTEVTAQLRARLARTGLPPETTTSEVLAYLALGGFARRGDVPLLRPKLHVFVRGLEGAVATFEGDALEPKLWFSAGEALAAGKTERQPTAVFPLSVCRTCGQHYLTTHLHDFVLDDGDVAGGEASGDSAYWLASPDPDAEGVERVRFTDWFLAEGDPHEDDDGNGGGKARSKASARLDERRSEGWLCAQCGCMHRDDVGACSNPHCAQPGPLAPIYLVHEPRAFRCLGCGATGRSGTGRDYEPIRPLRASTVADVHILAQEMISAAGADDERHLLIFADNRQDAAFQAGWMRDHARRYRLRYLMLEILGELEASGGGPVSVGDLHAELLRRLRADRDLARAVAPEAFDSGADESFGRAAAAQLSRFLRIQILRELATSFTQRDGLERWGQLRVVYAGLTPDDKRVRDLATELAMSPEALCDGISALLDAWRRARMLHDADEPIFARWWTGGSEEIQRGFIPYGFTEVRPVGIKLKRQGGDVDKWVRTVVSSRGRTGAVDFIRKWGVEDPPAAAEQVWELLRALDLVTPVKLVGGTDHALGGSAGTHQVDASRLGMVRQSERHVCSVCRRVHARPTPKGACSKTHCAGAVDATPPPADDYNVSLLSRPFSMVTAEEHTAQVPAERRDYIEKEFKRRGGTVNTLVASPTLELGVDIGALDLVLCRNVPPTPANYWQRVGRAGRRRRMAVVLVYCRRAVHDAYFFEQPEKLLGAPLRPPRFNLRNDVLVRKHVHAVVVSELLRLAKDDDATRGALEAALPQYVREYLFEGEDDRYRTAPADVRAPLGGLIDTNRQLLVDAVKSVFASGWPSEAATEVAPDQLEGLVLAMPGDLQGFVDHLHQRLTWVIETQRRLNAMASERLLTKDEERQRNRCGDYLHALKERQVRTYTLSVLAGEGFLPGYGLYDGGISAFPGWSGGAVSFELSRPQAIAVREFVPGNMLYANRGRYRTARYHFPVAGEEQQTEAYLADLASGFVTTAGTPSSGYGDSSPVELPGLPIADVDLAHVSPIRDEETDRFQVPVTILGMARRHRRGGTAWTFGERTVHHLLGQGLRLVNAGPADRVRAGEPGYPVCIVCGATRSPYASPKEHQDFTDWHVKHCGRRPLWLALTANVVADALHIHDLGDQGDAANLGEALRLGASQVLQMEPEDLQILPVPKADGRHDLYVYDPMPGGSGLLGQIIERWDEIASTLHDLLDECPGGCESSCYSCLRTGRNVFWHRFLDRSRALELVSGMGTAAEEGHELQQLEDASFLGPAATTNNAEDRLSEFLTRAGLDGFVGQHEVEIGPPYGRTIPDFAYVDAQVAVYLDGLSKGLHGNVERQRADAIIRGQLEDLDWKVVVIAASHLDDPVLLAAGFKRVARALKGKEAAAQITADGKWFHGDAATIDASENGAGEVAVLPAAQADPYVRHVPLYSIRAAAGRFLENAEAQEEGWVEVEGSLRDGMFAVRIAGRSMEPAIPDGAMAVFRADPAGAPLAGSREGKIVLAQLHEATDPEAGGSLTVKRYHSEKVAEEDGWQHARIVLQSLNREVGDIELTPDQDVDVIAEFVTVLVAPEEHAQD
ncbi:MAG: hypothetical protein QOG15_1973 [Solirubrobacteraceae bacterium]|jgi:ATP-dependent helicase YprA (DUF1998 family)|nr:hypothetical protein [Solirubrobacteraceae bacterium]